MKKIFVVMMLAIMLFTNCKKYNDAEIRSSINDLKVRVERLEKLCSEMNTNISSLQAIVVALQNRDAVVSVTDLPDNKGYTILFASGKSIFIYNGKDGSNGKDGYSPKIGVKQHTDGKYYWALDGNWILDDNSNMIPVTGEDGKDGANGKDGITPQLKIEDGYWYISYDNGATWQKLGKATGNNGLDGLPGEDGDSIIDSITQDEDNVYFKLTDGQVLTIMKRNSTTINFRDLYVEAICVRNWDANKDGQLSYSEAELVTSLNGAFTGNTNVVSFEELKYFTGLNKIEAQAFKGCTNLWRISLPANITIIESEAFVFCSALLSIRLDSSEVPTLDCTSLIKGRTDRSYHFAKASDSFKILVPEDYLNQYKTASGWKSYSSILMGM